MARVQVAALPPGPVDEAVWLRLRRALPDVSEKTLRTVLRESGLPLAPLVEGVRQDSLPHLNRTLADLAARSRRLRPEKHALKLEMALWIRAWLLNPALFPAWAGLRERQVSGSSNTATN